MEEQYKAKYVVNCQYPKASELNAVLYNRVSENLQFQIPGAGRGGPGGERTDWNLHKQNIKEIDDLISWVQHILPDVSKKFASKDDDNIHFGYDLNAFEIAECWGIRYNKDEYGPVEHNHFPYTLTFVYYVRTPDGSTPVIIENETYAVNEGTCIFFISSLYHSLKRNDCDGRCAIVGNILYRF